MGKLDNKVAFITGAARGQGRSHAIRFAEEGADIIAVDSCAPVDTIRYPMPSPEDLDETVNLVEKTGRRIVAGIVDVRDLTGLETFVSTAVDDLGGRLDVIVANAGVSGVSAALDLTAQTWQDMIDINLTGVFHTVKASAPHMISAGNGGSIALISSVVAHRAVQNLAHYTAAKNGVVGLMRVLALELAPHFIRVNTVHPTNVDTDMIQNDSLRRLFLPHLEHPTREESEPVYTSLNAIPIPWVEAVDISNALLYLVSDDGRYVTGAELPVDAGNSLL